MLVALIRRSVGAWPHVADFHIVVSRKFGFQGEQHSYLSASCPVPSGFPSFARATYTFADGRRLRIGAVRACRTR